MQMETNPTSLFGNARVLYSVKKPLGKHYQQKRRLLCSAPGYLYKLFSAPLVTTFTFLSLKVKALHYVHDFPMGHLIARPVTKIVYS